MNVAPLTETPALADVMAHSRDPFEGFSHNQWYCHQARQTVFYGAFLSIAPTREWLIGFAAQLVKAAPQLAQGYRGARPGGRLERGQLARLVALRDVAALDDFPAGLDVVGAELFADAGEPLFRVVGLVRTGGADAKGRAGAIFVVATHALMEGSDSALLSRSRTAVHAPLGPVRNPLPAWRRLWYKGAALILAPAQLGAALLIAPRKVDRVYRPFTVPRARLRRIAARFGVRQRSVMFALAAFALNRDGKGLSSRSLSILYADLNPSAARETGEDYFRYRMVETRFAVHKRFKEFVRGVDDRLSAAEKRDARGTQALLNAVFATHRALKKRMPRLYPERIFRFTGTYHLDLSVVPPVQLKGALTQHFMAPVFMGTFHPGLNVCVFSPSREYVTFNFTVREKLLPGLAGFEALIAELDPDTDVRLA